MVCMGFVIYPFRKVIMYSLVLPVLYGVLGNYAYGQGFSNEKSEEDARVAFTIFFVSLYGDIRTYLTQQTPGHPPVIDKEKFMRSRASNGDMPGSGMFLLLGSFS